jgi:glycosyltransferase involved in cell wall biosynthesis
MTSMTVQLDMAALQSVNAVMVENQWMLEYARNGTAKSNVIVQYAPPGVNIQLFHPSKRENTDRPYIMAVGRFADPRKNFNLLLDSFAQARKRVPELCLVMIGPDGPDDKFRRKVDELKIADYVKIRVRASDEELRALYRDAMCLVLSSDEEGFGMVIIEAMASGIPVVATRCGGPDGIITDGYDGYLVPVGNSSALADRVATLASDPSLRRIMGRRARATVEERFSEDKAGAAFLSVYDTLLSNAAAGLV